MVRGLARSIRHRALIEERNICGPRRSSMAAVKMIGGSQIAILNYAMT
jgi:hypothetical protein